METGWSLQALFCLLGEEREINRPKVVTVNPREAGKILNLRGSSYLSCSFTLPFKFCSPLPPFQKRPTRAGANGQIFTFKLKSITLLVLNWLTSSSCAVK